MRIFLFCVWSALGGISGWWGAGGPSSTHTYMEARNSFFLGTWLPLPQEGHTLHGRRAWPQTGEAETEQNGLGCRLSTAWEPRPSEGLVSRPPFAELEQADGGGGPWLEGNSAVTACTAHCRTGHSIERQGVGASKSNLIRKAS